MNCFSLYSISVRVFATDLLWRAYSPNVTGLGDEKRVACANVYGKTETLDNETAYVLERRRDPVHAGSLLAKSAPSLLVYPNNTRGNKAGRGTARCINNATNGYNILQRLHGQDPRQQQQQQQQQQQYYQQQQQQQQYHPGMHRERLRHASGRGGSSGDSTSGMKRAPIGFLSSPSLIACAVPTKAVELGQGEAGRVAHVHLPANDGGLLSDLLHRTTANTGASGASLSSDRAGLEVTILVSEPGQRTVQCQVVVPVPPLANLVAQVTDNSNSSTALGGHQTLPPLCTSDLTGPTRDVRLSRAEALGVDLNIGDGESQDVVSGVPGKHHYVEFKRAITLMPSETAQLAQQDTSKVCVYNSLAEAFDAMERVLPSGRELMPVRVLRRWSHLNTHGKLRFLAAMPCDELRFFVMKKDPELFRHHVQQNVGARHVKSFMDLYLTNDVEALRTQYM
jgi:hypothetical protein